MIVIDWELNKAIPNLVYGVVATGICSLIQVIYRNKEFIINIFRNKFVEIVIFIFSYISPLIMFIYAAFDDIFFRNNLLILIIVGLVFIFNILMDHILKIYEMFSELTNKANNNDKVQKEAINKICQLINLPPIIK